MKTRVIGQQRGSLGAQAEGQAWRREIQKFLSSGFSEELASGGIQRQRTGGGKNAVVGALFIFGRRLAHTQKRTGECALPNMQLCSSCKDMGHVLRLPTNYYRLGGLGN